MLGDDEDVFDSVTWESPSAPPFNQEEDDTPSNGPGFRQSTTDSNDGPLDPKWEGYLITSVKDPVKELAETKDAYVSYLVSARVSLISRKAVFTYYNALPDKPSDILLSQPIVSETLSGPGVSARKPRQRLPSLRRSCSTRQTQTRCVLLVCLHLRGIMILLYRVHYRGQVQS